MSIYSSEMDSLSLYSKFIKEVHSGCDWSDGFLYDPLLKNKSKYYVVPQCIGFEKAAANGIFWFDGLKKIYDKGFECGVVRDLIVHGSFGDFSSTEFSDLEITVLIDDSVFLSNEKKKLLSFWIKSELNKFMVKMDPLQHHGAFYIWNNLLNNYSELILPACAYDSCWSISGNPIKFHVITDSVDVVRESSIRLKLTLENLADPDKFFFQFGYNDYSVKRYLSNLFMVPAFFYQSKGCVLSKRDSINKFLHEYKEMLFSEAIILATNLRSNWPKKSGVLRLIRPFFVTDRIPQGKLDFILLAIFSNSMLNLKFKNDILPMAINGASEILKELNENH